MEDSLGFTAQLTTTLQSVEPGVYQVHYAGSTYSNISRASLEIPVQALEELTQEVNTWREVTEYDHGSLVGRIYEAPALVVRADCVINRGRLQVICEIDDTPSGEALTAKFNVQFRHLLTEVMSSRWWPRGLRAVVAPNRENDINNWLDGLTLDEARKHNGPLWVTCRPDDKDYHDLISRSVTPIQLAGRKRSLCDLEFTGDAQVVRFEDLKYLDWGENFVVKPEQGTRSRDILIWRAREPTEGVEKLPRANDESSRSRIERKMQTAGDLWIHQRYVRPDPLPEYVQEMMGAMGYSHFSPKWHGTHRGTYRIFFVLAGDSYLPLGGTVTSRYEKYAMIHGASDAVFTAATLPKHIHERVLSQI